MSNNKIGRFQIVREIARSNDIVYEAVDPVMGRRVAVKELLLPPNLVGAQKRERIERFYREAKAAGTLTHPNIVTIYEVSEDQGRHFIAMEYLDGHSLRDQLQMQGLVSVPEALRIGIAIAEALHYAHEHGVIHRDVKPDNVHLLPDGRVKLTDFGIARLMFEATLTANGQVFGTPSYMSPEQVEGKQLDPRSDIFSLGVMLYEMVAGRKPFTGDSVITITYNIMNGRPAPLSGVPPAVDRIIARAMAKDPSLRYRTAAEMAEEMRAARDTLTRATRSTAPSAAGPVLTGSAAGAGTRAAPAALPAGGGGAVVSSRGTTPGSQPAVAAAANPFLHLQPDDLWFPRAPRRPFRLSARTRAALGNLVLVAIVAMIMWFLFWSTMTAYEEFLHAADRKEAAQLAARAQKAFDEGRFPLAAQLYHEAYRKAPTFPPMQIARANAAIAAIQEGNRWLSSDRAAAHQWYLRAQRYDPEYPGTYQILALLAYNDGRGNMKRADMYWQRALELWGRWAASQDPRRQSDGQAGIEEVERTAAIAWYNRGELLMSQNRLAEARAAWQRAMHYGGGTDVGFRAQLRLNEFGSIWGGF